MNSGFQATPTVPKIVPIPTAHMWHNAAKRPLILRDML